MDPSLIASALAAAVIFGGWLTRYLRAEARKQRRRLKRLEPILTDAIAWGNDIERAYVARLGRDGLPERPASLKEWDIYE